MPTCTTTLISTNRKNMKATSEIRQFVETRYAELGNKRGTYQTIVNEVKDKFDEVLGYDTVRKMCKSID